MKKRFIYIPFGFWGAGDLKRGRPHNNWNGQYRKAHPLNNEKRFYVLYYEGPKHKSDALSSADSETQIYVLGHGGAGSAYISNQYDYGKFQPVSKSQAVKATQIVAELKNKGLRKDFNGVVKCYSCHSAESNGEGISFAAQVASAFRNQKYDAVQVWGYRGELSFYRKGKQPKEGEDFDDEEHGTHKWSTIQGAGRFRASNRKEQF